MTEREALKLALEALEEFGEHYDWCHQFPTYVDPESHPPCNCGYDEAITSLRQAIAEAEKQVTYTGNGTVGREADVKPTGFFFQMPEKIGSYTSDNPEHQKLDLSLCDAKRVQLPVGEVYGWHGTGKDQPLTDEQIEDEWERITGHSIFGGNRT